MLAVDHHGGVAQAESPRVEPVHIEASPAYAWTLAAFLVLLAVSWWRPIHPAEQGLHHSLTAIGLVALVVVHRRRPLPYGSFLLVLIFLTLHTIAARPLPGAA